MLEIFAQRAIWKNCIEVLVVANEGQGRKSVAKPLTLEPVENGEVIGQPTMNLRPEEAQLLMDELWRCGLRPTEGTGSAGSLAATERHLSDMQHIAMGLLKKHGV